MVFVVLIIALLLIAFGYKKEAGNAVYAILIAIGIGVGIAIIGFGLCLVSGAHW
jgi:hypothetical protein